MMNYDAMAMDTEDIGPRVTVREVRHVSSHALH